MEQQINGYFHCVCTRIIGSNLSKFNKMFLWFKKLLVDNWL